MTHTHPGGVTWTLGEAEDYKRQRDGETMKLWVWRSACAVCGAPIQVKTVTTDPETPATGRNLLKKHCPEHAWKFPAKGEKLGQRK